MPAIYPEQYRQGDVFIQREEFVTDNLKKVQPDDDRVILAYGEATGHTHSLPAIVTTRYQWDGDTLIDVSEKTEITHQEHDPIPLAPGKYKVWIQMEYCPAELPRQVID